MQDLKTLIVDDHNIVREGLKFILQQQENFQIEVLEAFNSKSCSEALSTNKVDVVLMDINLGAENGIDLTKHILKNQPDMNVIAISMHEEEYIIKQMMQAGAKGYLLKNTSAEELNLALETVMNGEIYCSYKIALNIVNYTADQKKSEEELKASLTTREKQILRLIVDEMTNDEIASSLQLSKRTVDGHRQNLINKLKVRNTAGLVRFAIESGI